MFVLHKPESPSGQQNGEWEWVCVEFECGIFALAVSHTNSHCPCAVLQCRVVVLWRRIVYTRNARQTCVQQQTLADKYEFRKRKRKRVVCTARTCALAAKGDKRENKQTTHAQAAGSRQQRTTTTSVCASCVPIMLEHITPQVKEAGAHQRK